MKKTLTFGSIFLAGVFAFSCKTSTILKTNFNAEVVNRTPSRDIPGGPSGDSIRYLSEIAPALAVKHWNSTTSKALEFSYMYTPGISEHDTGLSFRGIPSNFAQTVWYIYTAKHEGEYGTVVANLSDGGGLAYIAQMKIDATGQVTLVGRDWTGERVIGNIPPGVVHTVFFTVNLASSTYNVLIDMPGRDRIEVRNRPMITGNRLVFLNPARPSISFNFDNQTSTGRKYIIQNVLITRKEPN